MTRFLGRLAMAPEALQFTQDEMAAIQTRIEQAVARLCPPWLRPQQEDLVQQAMIRIVQQLRKQGGQRTLNATYLRRTAHSAIMDEIRKRRPDRGERLSGEGVERVADPVGPAPERDLHASEVGRAIRECLQTTVESRRQAVTLYLLGHTVPQTGSLLGFPTKKAENLVYRGLADLRRCLDGKGVRP